MGHMRARHEVLDWYQSEQKRGEGWRLHWKRLLLMIDEAKPSKPCVPQERYKDASVISMRLTD